MHIDLYDYQLEAVNKLQNGNILVGGVGSGKSRTALAYYYISVCKGSMKINNEGRFSYMKEPRDLYVITTAKKRDTQEWIFEAAPFCLPGQVEFVVDSWNNIKKYTKVHSAFFIFDEQRVVGYGAWTKAFLNIARKNQWILLSATPGDTWMDYLPVFMANGFFKSKSEFMAKHCVFNRYTKYPKIDKYVGQGTLSKYRSSILVPMNFERKTVSHKIFVPCNYDERLYKIVWRDRWDPYDNEPIAETGKLFYLLRKVVNSDRSRLQAVRDICERHKRVIIFYNYTYEVELLRSTLRNSYDIGEWNGEVHSEVPSGDSWAYLVQYSAGCEGWNCITTNAMIFFSQSYSYRMTRQAEGRIDRLNTSYKDLYYYKLRSSAPIDLAIHRALSMKKNFNERSFIGK